MKWAGLKESDPIIHGYVAEGDVSLIDLNDEYEKTFKQIATIIDKHL
jgi:hypothetical protein